MSHPTHVQTGHGSSERHKPQQEPLQFLKYRAALSAECLGGFSAYSPPVPTAHPIPQNKTKSVASPVPSYRIVPARRGLKAYSQSFMSLSLMACSSTPRCFVHTPNVLGVCNRKDNLKYKVYKHRGWCTFPLWGICSVPSLFHLFFTGDFQDLLVIIFYKTES